MSSVLLSLNYKDFSKGAVLAVIVAVLGALQQAVTAHGFDLAAYDWGTIFDLAFTTFFAYLAKNWMSDQDGKVFGKIG